MSQDSQIFLKPAVFGGFEKKAVLSYIFELNESTQDAQQKLSAQMEDLTKSRDAVSEELKSAELRFTDAQSELQEAKEQLSENAVKIAEADSRIQGLQDEIESLNDVITKKNADIARYMSVNGDLEKENKELSKKMQSFSEKRSQFEQAATQLNEMMGRAKGDATKIVEQAKATAAKITSGANIQAENILESAKQNAQKQILDASGRIDGIYKQFDGFCAELASLKQTISGAASAMNERIDTLHKAASKAKVITIEKAFSQESHGGPEKNTRSFANDGSSSATSGVRKDDSGFFRLAAED